MAIKNYNKFGKTDVEVSEIGFGTWGLGGNAYGQVNDCDSLKSLELALEMGINVYDTADLYGNGHSEEMLEKAFSSKRDKVIIASKGGTLPHTGFHMPMDFSIKHMTEAFEGSLKRLNTDYIDIYQLHSPQLTDLYDELFEFLHNLKKSGKARAIGVSAKSPLDAKEILTKYDIDSIQVNFNMVDQRVVEDGILDLALEKNVAVIARTPLVFGYLTGTMSGEEKLQDGFDHRANWPKEQLKTWGNASVLFDKIAKKYGMTSVQLAINFCISHKAVTTVIPGMLLPEHVKENASTSTFPKLTDEDIKEIFEIYKSNDFYDKTAKSKGKQ